MSAYIVSAFNQLIVIEGDPPSTTLVSVAATVLPPFEGANNSECVVECKDGILTEFCSCRLRKRGLLSINLPSGGMGGTFIVDHFHTRNHGINFVAKLPPSSREVKIILDDDAKRCEGVIGCKSSLLFRSARRLRRLNIFNAKLRWTEKDMQQ
ncbi:unnamed protein product [Lactuca virosa]|uniref:Uncharacterized protein n=1 Tax=Lactuca virosa TaxID=75947 RepID=A0AAU9PQR4_9ASTR|nr:unnamed protein product [Lactuca virosa]